MAKCKEGNGGKVLSDSCRGRRGSGMISPVGMQEGSHKIAKMKPKIRIVHILAPEIIKTDAANFRQLVQQLTGKPSKRVEAAKRSKAVELEVKVDEDEDEDEDGFLCGIGDVDGFLQGFGNDYPNLLPLSCSQMVEEIGVGDVHL
ncbi:hypothetical protein J5N97_008137 [Dioscorea zingiberensis]|uniref:VQ domain-containing protein n=1 Tax=Dioscorea zingiberensis TaxID=325984 RepID=A0A9D5DDA4_9LILI|nr:hypothetical protein J5N97_008137 [Dioscorea zingiberensis]